MWKCSKAMGNFLLHQHVNSEETNCVSLFPLHCSVALLCLFNWKQTPESFTLIVRLVYFICKKQHQVPSKLWIMFFDISLLLARLCAKYLKHKAAFFSLKTFKSWLKVWVGWYSMCCHISVCDIRQSVRLLNICWALSCSTDLLSPCSTIKMKWSMYQQEGRKHGGMHTSTDAPDLAHYLFAPLVSLCCEH